MADSRYPMEGPRFRSVREAATAVASSRRWAQGPEGEVWGGSVLVARSIDELATLVDDAGWIRRDAVDGRLTGLRWDKIPWGREASARRLLRH